LRYAERYTFPHTVFLCIGNVRDRRFRRIYAIDMYIFVYAERYRFSENHAADRKGRDGTHRTKLKNTADAAEEAGE
jgi:hypothetical protein